MVPYLTFIFLMNASGALLLLACFRDEIADLILRRGTYLIAGDVPVTHTAHSRIWLVWAVVGAVVFSGWNFVARSWPPEFARVIVLGDVVAYSLFWVSALVGSMARRREGSGFGPGIVAGHILWPAQAAWGLWVWMTT